MVNIMAEERNLLIVDMVKKKKKNMKVIRKEKNMKDVRERKKEKNIIEAVIKAGLETSSNDNMKKKAVNGGKKKDKNKVISSEKS